MKTARNLVILLILALLQGQLTARDVDGDDADNIEIKFVVKETEVEKAIEALGLDKATAEKRTIYFFDTKDLSLFEQPGPRVILRARTEEGEREGETTVKLRSKEPLQIEAEWLQEKRNGEKLVSKREKDQVVTKAVVHSYSLDDDEDMEEIEQAIEGRQSVKKIFSSNQEDLVEAKSKPKLDWDKLEALGPVKVLKWEFKARGLELVAERWEFGSHPPTLEVSTKVDESDAAETTDKLVAFMQEKQLQQDPNPETKTKEVLEYFADGD
jgi:hypothetical protein